MKKIRINELARDLEIKANLILDKLPDFGVTEKKTHSSSVDEDVAEKLRHYFVGGGGYQRETDRNHQNGAAPHMDRDNTAETLSSKSAVLDSKSDETITRTEPRIEDLPAPTPSTIDAPPANELEEKPAPRISLRPPLASPLRPPVGGQRPAVPVQSPPVSRGPSQGAMSAPTQVAAPAPTPSVPVSTVPVATKPVAPKPAPIAPIDSSSRRHRVDSCGSGNTISLDCNFASAGDLFTWSSERSWHSGRAEACAACRPADSNGS